MVSMLAVDSQNLTEFPHHCNSAWSCIMSIMIAIILLWFQIGVSAIAGVLVMALMLPLTSFITNKSKKSQVKKLRQQDSRIKTINEALNGIKVNSLF